MAGWPHLCVVTTIPRMMLEFYSIVFQSDKKGEKSGWKSLNLTKVLQSQHPIDNNDIDFIQATYHLLEDQLMHFHTCCNIYEYVITD